jgi:hypothetical protein
VSAPCYDLVLRHGIFTDDLSANSDFCCLLLNSEVPELFYKHTKISKAKCINLVSAMNKHSGMVPRLWNLKKGCWFRKMCKTNGVNRPTVVLYPSTDDVSANV